MTHKPVKGHSEPGEHKNFRSTVNANNMGPIAATTVPQVPPSFSTGPSKSPQVKKGARDR